MRLDCGGFTACRPYAGIRAHAAGPVLLPRERDLVLHLEFQSTVDRAMAVRMLAYTTLLQKLIGEGVLPSTSASAGAADRRHLQRPTAGNAAATYPN